MPMDNLDFNENFFVNSTSDEIKQEQRKVFLKFITNWIAHFTNRDVNRFSLTISNPQTCRDKVERCVAFAMQHGVRYLNLDFSDPKWDENDLDDHDALFQLPSIVYELGSSLESLKLYSCGFCMQYFVNFTSLKDVSLGWIEVRTRTLETLLSTCRTIESLSLEKCWNSVNISLGDDQPIGLTRLVINKCDSEYFMFKAPNLKYFKYSGAVFTSDIYVRPNVIEEIDIDFSLESEFYERGNELCKILVDFAAAKVLTVCSYLLQVVPSGDEPVRTEIALNVRHLILKTQMHSHEFCGFEFLLNSCPMLEKITLDIGPRAIFSDEDYETPVPGIDLKKYWQLRRVIPECLRRSLKAIEVMGSRMTEEEFMTLLFFILTGKVLEQININLCNENDDGLNQLRLGRARLLANAQNQKASEMLQININ